MQLHTLKRKTPNKKATQVGRGGTRGKTSGRGTKGQKARSGHKIRPEIRDSIKRLPKLRGRGKNSNLTIQVKPVVVSISTIEKHYENGAEVSVANLIEKKIVSSFKGKNPKVKILSGKFTGKEENFTKKINVKGITLSASAKNLIEKAGGTVA